jgi:hypothetical protein
VPKKRELPSGGDTNVLRWSGAVLLYSRGCRASGRRCG